MTLELMKIYQLSNLIIGQDTNITNLISTQEFMTNHNLFQTIKELFNMQSLQQFDSKCSIDGDIK
jgi:hypothetical protein